MCGILGFWGDAAFAWPDLATWAKTLRHRGPDDVGTLAVPLGNGLAAGLAHARLAIIDLSASGHQPMTEASGRYVVVFNGEIYNYRALRAELEAAGDVFTSTSDTEVLLRGYIRWGKGVLDRLRGMFAFVILDRSEHRLFIARDRLGVKPLYLTRAGGGLAFASELRALFAVPGVSRRLDRASVDAFLTFGSVVEPRTIVESVELLPAGTWLERDPSGERRGTYYRLPVEAPDASLGGVPLAESVRDTLATAVALRLEADVPVGIFLSGGVDSGVVASLAAQATRSPLHSFTVTFDAGESEAEPARALARRLSLVHHEAHLRTTEMLADVPVAVAALDQPSVDGINTYFVSRAARASGLSVALSGIGGDELFAGYGAFRRFARIWQRMPRMPRPLSAGLAALDRAPRLPLSVRKVVGVGAAGRDASRVYAELRTLFSRGLRRRLLGGAAFDRSPLLGASLADADPINAYGAMELEGYLRNTLLRDTDVMSMAHSLEVREPLLDHELVALAMRIPGARKLSATTNKPLLAGAVPDLPKPTAQAAKRGFTLPFDAWIRGPLRPFVEARLASVPAPLDRREVARLWAAFLAGSRETSWARVWALAVLSDYCARHGLAG